MTSKQTITDETKKTTTKTKTTSQDPGGQVPQPEHRQDRVLGHRSLESLDSSLLMNRKILMMLS